MMSFDSGTWWLVLAVLGFITSSLTYLIKFALFSKLEKVEGKIDEFEKELVSKKDYEKEMECVRDDIETIKANYTPKSEHDKDFDECRSDIKKITEGYLTKEDFLREQAKTDRKLDKVLDILLEINGKNERC